MIDDLTLIEQFLHSADRQAFVTLIERHRPGIRRLLYSLFVGHREDMEDAEQEILLSLYQDLHRFRGSSSFKTYLYRYSRNRAIDMLRKKGRERRALQSLYGEEPSGITHPEEMVLLRESRQEILDILFRMEEEERTLILLKDVEELSIREVSEIMKLPEGTVKSRLHRTRERLANKLRGGLS